MDTCMGNGGAAAQGESSSSGAGDAIGPNKRIDRRNFIRLLQQALHRLGYSDVAGRLEQESGIEMQPAFATRFQDAVRLGDWRQAIALLPRVMQSCAAQKEGEFIILKQKYNECLQAADQAGALKCLRSELAPLNVNQHELHDLAVALLCGQPQRPAHLSAEEHVKGQRAQVLEDLQRLLLPSLIIPDGRLEYLVEQALLTQVARCQYHNGDVPQLSLFSDYSAGREQLPTKTVQVLDAHSDEVWHVQFSHNGKMLASASKDSTSMIWEVSHEGECNHLHTLQGPDAQLTYVAWSYDDTMLLTCGNSGICGLWNVSTGELIKTLKGHTNTVVAAAWFPDGVRFVTGGYDNTTVIWNTEGQVLSNITGTKVHDLVVTSDGEFVVSVVSNNLVRIQRMSDNASAHIAREDCMTSLALSPDNEQLLLNLSSQTINLWSMSTLKQRLQDKSNCGGRSPVRQSATDGSRRVNSSSGPLEQSLMEYNRDPSDKYGRFVIRSGFGGSHANFVVSGSDDSQVYIWHKDSGDLLEVMPGHSGTVNAVTWNPIYHHLLASGSDDRSIRIWMSPAAL